MAMWDTTVRWVLLFYPNNPVIYWSFCAFAKERDYRGVGSHGDGGRTRCCSTIPWQSSPFNRGGFHGHYCVKTLIVTLIAIALQSLVTKPGRYLALCFLCVSCLSLIFKLLHMMPVSHPAFILSFLCLCVYVCEECDCHLLQDFDHYTLLTACPLFC